LWAKAEEFECHCQTFSGAYCKQPGSGIGCMLKDPVVNFMFMDPCIIVQFLQRKTQQDATVYQNFIIPHFK